MEKLCKLLSALDAMDGRRILSELGTVFALSLSLIMLTFIFPG
jgi:hypothetical protein